MTRKPRPESTAASGLPDGTNPLDRDAERVEILRTRLAEWFAAGHRALPWRTDRDPYRVLVSELMLVQTTVAAVVPFFQRFLERFPTIEALAAADEAVVLKAWEGLGYYRRARQLHEAARILVRDHGGTIPDQPEVIRGLPGVGRYVAGAVLSLAFDRPLPILEANTRRVLARLLCWTSDLAEKRSEDRLWLAAERLVPAQSAGRFNEAMMELGATVCTVREPSCLICPLAIVCQARALGMQDRVPVKTHRSPPREVLETTALVRRDDGHLLVVRRAPGGLWAGFWEFPTIHAGGADPARRSFGEQPVELAEGVRRLTGIEIEVVAPWRTVRFGVTTHRVTLSAHTATFREGEPRPGPQLDAVAWEPPAALRQLTMGSAQRRLFKGLEPGGSAE